MEDSLVGEQTYIRLITVMQFFEFSVSQCCILIKLQLLIPAGPFLCDTSIHPSIQTDIHQSIHTTTRPPITMSIKPRHRNKNHCSISRCLLLWGLTLSALHSCSCAAVSQRAAPNVKYFNNTNVCLELPKQGPGTSTERLKFIGTYPNHLECASATANWHNNSAPVGRKRYVRKSRL